MQFSQPRIGTSFYQATSTTVGTDGVLVQIWPDGTASSKIGIVCPSSRSSSALASIHSDASGAFGWGAVCTDRWQVAAGRMARGLGYRWYRSEGDGCTRGSSCCVGVVNQENKKKFPNTTAYF